MMYIYYNRQVFTLFNSKDIFSLSTRSGRKENRRSHKSPVLNSFNEDDPEKNQPKKKKGKEKNCFYPEQDSQEKVKIKVKWQKLTKGIIEF